MIGMCVEDEVRWKQCNLSGNKLVAVSWIYPDYQGGLDQIHNHF